MSINSIVAGVLNRQSNVRFEDKLLSVNCLAELEGFANRRRYDHSLPKWSDGERAQIIAYKYRLMQGRCAKCSIGECTGHPASR
jgi:hypothetical protein